jgi:hypothetical protein
MDASVGGVASQAACSKGRPINKHSNKITPPCRATSPQPSAKRVLHMFYAIKQQLHSARNKGQK